MTAAAGTTEDLAPLDVVCAAAGISLAVPPGSSVLEAVRAAGLEGVPDHRDGVLSAEERRVGETMMICVSRAATPRLVLDL